jgi:E3 ubiquitin-protein ligase RNF13
MSYLHILILTFTMAISIESKTIIEVFNEKNVTMNIEIEALNGPIVPISGFKGYLVIANPRNACSIIDKPPNKENGQYWIVLIERTKSSKRCRFEKKVFNAENAGYDAVIIHNTYSDELINMDIACSSITIPSLFIGYSDAKLLENYTFESKSYLQFRNDNLQVYDLNIHKVIMIFIITINSIVLIGFYIAWYLKLTKPIANRPIGWA